MATTYTETPEGYYDPTAGAVIAKCNRKEKATAGKLSARLTHRQERSLPKAAPSFISAALMPGIPFVTFSRHRNIADMR